MPYWADTGGNAIMGFSDIDTNGNGVLDGGDQDVVEAKGNTILKIFFEGNEQIWFEGVQGGQLVAGDFIVS